MDETANWAVCPYAGGGCTPPSQAQFMSLIGASDEIAVIADVGPDGTGETYDLDNVTLTDGGPPPPTAAPRTQAQEVQEAEQETCRGGKKCKKKRRAAALPSEADHRGLDSPFRQRS